MKLDALDRGLLKNLQADGRLSLRRLGRILDVPHTTVFTHLNKLVKNGVIRNFTAIVQPHDIGLKINFIIIDTPTTASKEIAKLVAESQEVLNVYRTGDGKILAKTITQKDCQQRLGSIMPKLRGYNIRIYQIEEVVKYDYQIHDVFIDQIRD